MEYGSFNSRPLTAISRGNGNATNATNRFGFGRNPVGRESNVSWGVGGDFGGHYFSAGASYSRYRPLGQVANQQALVPGQNLQNNGDWQSEQQGSYVRGECNRGNHFGRTESPPKNVAFASPQNAAEADNVPNLTKHENWQVGESNRGNHFGRAIDIVWRGSCSPSFFYVRLRGSGGEETTPLAALESRLGAEQLVPLANPKVLQLCCIAGDNGVCRAFIRDIPNKGKKCQQCTVFLFDLAYQKKTKSSGDLLQLPAYAEALPRQALPCSLAGQERFATVKPERFWASLNEFRGQLDARLVRKLDHGMYEVELLLAETGTSLLDLLMPDGSIKRNAEVTRLSLGMSQGLSLKEKETNPKNSQLLAQENGQLKAQLSAREAELAALTRKLQAELQQSLVTDSTRYRKEIAKLQNDNAALLKLLVNPDECTICMEPYAIDRPIHCIGPCGHCFCRSCIDRHAKSHRSDRMCPMCKADFSESIRLFNT